MSNPWPCWACKWRTDKDATGTYSCARPTNLEALSIWERWRLQDVPLIHGRYIGTERQIRGESPNDRPECPVMEAA